MYTCPTCGNPISANAPICFNCGETAWGRPMPGNYGGGEIGGTNAVSGCFGLLAVIVFMMFISCAGLRILLFFF